MKFIEWLGSTAQNGMLALRKITPMAEGRRGNLPNKKSALGRGDGGEKRMNKKARNGGEKRMVNKGIKMRFLR